MKERKKTSSTNSSILIVKSTGISLFFKVIGMGLGFFVQVILGEKLSVSNYGNFTLFITVVNVVSVFTLLGMDSGLIRMLPRVDTYKQKSLILKCSITLIVTILFEWVLYALFFKIIKGDLHLLVSEHSGYFFMLLFVVSFTKIFDGVLYGNKLAIQVNFFSVVFLNGVRFPLILIFYQKENGLVGAIGIFIVSELMACLGKVIYYHKYVGRGTNKGSYSNKEFGDFMKYTLTLCVITSVNILVVSMDKLMLYQLKGSYYVGQYKIAENFIPLIYIFSSSSMIFWPMISSMYKDGKIELLFRKFRDVIKMIALFTIPMFVFMVIYAEQFVLIFGQQYGNSSKILMILLLGALVDSLAGPVGALLNMTEYAKYNLYDVLIACVFNFLLNWVLIPIFGGVGAALASFISLLFLNIIFVLQIKRFMKVFLYEKENLYLVLSGGGLLLIDIVLFRMIKSHIYIKMGITVLSNYVVFFVIYTRITKLDYRKVLEKLLSGRVS